MQGHILRISVLSAAYDGAACYVPQSSAVPVPSERHVLPGPKNFKVAFVKDKMFLFIDMMVTVGPSSTGRTTLAASGRFSLGCLEGTVNASLLAGQHFDPATLQDLPASYENLMILHLGGGRLAVQVDLHKQCQPSKSGKSSLYLFIDLNTKQKQTIC